MILRSLSKHFDELQHLIDEYQSKPNFLCLSETWLSIDKPFEQLDLNDYKLNIFSTSNKLSGVVLYIFSIYFLRDKRTRSQQIQQIDFSTFSGQIILVNFAYKSPRNSNREILMQFDEHL